MLEDSPGPTEAPELRAAKVRRRRRLHQFFEIGIFLKGADGVLELAGGLLLLLLSAAQIRGTIDFLVQGELQEDPADLIANLVLHHMHAMIQSRSAASLFLIVHGAAKLALVGGLLMKQRWSYPAAIVVFTGFASYQGYQLLGQTSLLLASATIVDIVVVFLIALEYRVSRTERVHSRGSS